MTFQRRKQKGRSDSGTFFTIPHAIMDSPNWHALPVRAIKLTLDLTEKLMRDKLRMGREYERITTGILPMSPVEEPPEYVIENMAPSGGPAATLPQAIPDASDPLGLRPKR